MKNSIKWLFKLTFKTSLFLVKYVALCIFLFSIYYSYKHLYLYPKVKNKTFLVFTDTGINGTGFLYTYNGTTVTVTNFHVCRFQKKLNVKVGNWFDRLEVIAVDMVNDICILESVNNESGLKNFTNPYSDKPIFSRGFMNRHDRPIIEGYIIKSVVKSKLSFRIQNEDEYILCKNELMLQPILNRGKWLCVTEIYSFSTSVRIDSGQSGSAVVDYYGSVLGVFSMMNRKTKFGYYIPIERVNGLIERNLK